MDEPRLEVSHAPSPALVEELDGLLRRIGDGPGTLSEGRRRALGRAAAGDPSVGFVAVTARHGGNGSLVGYALVDHEGDPSSSSMERVTDGGSSVADGLLRTAMAAVAAAGGGRLRLWVTSPTPDDDARAEASGFAVERDLLQLRCPLPLPPPADGEVTVATRPFRVGVDEDAWIEANNRAFAGHPEQGAWDRATLHAREQEPWFDPEGFRVLDVRGRLVGSCWTKRHGGTRPPMGEIYVISVDPRFHGKGWGRALTRAGLEWLASRSLTVGMLYVDGANTAAVSLYRSMGFTTHHLDRSYVAPVAPAAAG